MYQMGYNEAEYNACLREVAYYSAEMPLEDLQQKHCNRINVLMM
jgi:hypothetical protein